MVGIAIKSLIAASALALVSSHVGAFQLAPMGSKMEARFTNETDSRRALVAGRLGILIKHPVHEEITHLGFGCPLPVHSTQPDCWYCLFKEASRTAISRKITGCEKGPEFVKGTLMTRSHFGDLQFLHAMARDDGTPPQVTRKKVLEWIEFAWHVFSKEIRPDTLMKDVAIPTIHEHFACSGSSVADIYIMGQGEWLRPRLADVAFGSLIHTVQDSFAGGHVTRQSPNDGEVCLTDPPIPRPGRIEEFHTYGSQDSTAHDEEDSRVAMALSARETFPDAVEVTKRLFELYEARASWDVAQPYISCVFDLADFARPATPGPFTK